MRRGLLSPSLAEAVERPVMPEHSKAMLTAQQVPAGIFPHGGGCFCVCGFLPGKHAGIVFEPVGFLQPFRCLYGCQLLQYCHTGPVQAGLFLQQGFSPAAPSFPKGRA